jgi:hypothetical protein
MPIRSSGEKSKIVDTEGAPSPRHASDDDLQLYIRGDLSAAEVDIVERHLSDCPQCKNRLVSAARFVAQIADLKRDDLKKNDGHLDRRAGPRFRASDTGFLRCFSPLLPGLWPIQTIDVSRNGLSFLVPINLAPGTLIQVHIGDIFALGEVRHSKQVGEHQFRAGIRLQIFFRREE